MATTGSQLEKSVPVGQATLIDRMIALWTLARLRWETLDRRQRTWSIGSAVILAALLGLVLWLGLRTDWRTLYTGLEAADQRQVAQILSAASIPFELTADGAGIRVPASQLDKARLATSAKGAFKSGRLGFDIFDKPNWVGSEFDEQVNYQRALEGELEHTLGALADVESARVHLVMPHDSLFRESERPAKASVELKLRRRTLAEGEAESIRNLVAAAVDGLSPERVVLVDADGHLPLGPKTPDAARLEAEQVLEEKLIATLEPVTGRGNVRASITLEYNPTASEETSESYDPQKTVQLTMQHSEQNSAPRPVAAGAPGAASNSPNAQPALPVYPQQTTGQENAKSDSGTFAASKIVRHIEEKPGRIRRMTAAILVNDRLIQAPGKGKAAQWQTRSADELRNLTTLAQAAVGYDQGRGDQLAVADLPFDANRPQPSLSPAYQLVNKAESFPLLMKYSAMLLAVLAVLILGVRPALKRANGKSVVATKGAQAKASGKEAEVDKEHAVASPHTPAQLAAAFEAHEADPERQRAQEILNQVSAFLKRDPTQSSRLIQSWIHLD